MLATFEEVTSDFGAIVEIVNRKFGTSFKPFVHTAENVSKVMQIIEEMDKVDQGKATVTETTVARPSKIRERLKQKRRKELEASSVSVLLEEATKVYIEMVEQRD